ncbi:MAG TPA: hypothetical protein VFW02_07030 [Candidatus Limnocylindrales bacterium]|nr:hypothetical protein [Candidatus Limnocylindrales bacterium]
MSLARRRRGRLPLLRIALIAIVAGALIGVFAVSTDAFGAGNLFERAVARIDRFIAGPVPDRPSDGTILVTPAPRTPDPTPTPTPTQTRRPSTAASSTPVPPPTPSPTPARTPIDVDIVPDPESVFAHELEKTWCAPAGVQMALAVLGLADTSHDFQRELQGRVREWESYGDSHNGSWGPSAMALALEAYGVPGYEVRGYETRADALRDAAAAIETTRAPVILLAWRGAHTWVMTGFRADADPLQFGDATVEGAYVLDPWYPWVSSIWGPSDPPGTFQDTAEMERNYLRWKRPEGLYPERDGLFISVVPTVAVSSPG